MEKKNMCYEEFVFSLISVYNSLIENHPFSMASEIKEMEKRLQIEMDRNLRLEHVIESYEEYLQVLKVRLHLLRALSFGFHSDSFLQLEIDKIESCLLLPKSREEIWKTTKNNNHIKP